MIWEQLGENGGGEPVERELRGNGEDGIGNWDALEENGSGELGECGEGFEETWESGKGLG